MTNREGLKKVYIRFNRAIVRNIPSTIGYSAFGIVETVLDCLQESYIGFIYVLFTVLQDIFLAHTTILVYIVYNFSIIVTYLSRSSVCTMLHILFF